MSLESRINKLEQRNHPGNKDILVIRPEENEEEKLKRYEAEHGEQPGLVIKVVRAKTEVCHG